MSDSESRSESRPIFCYLNSKFKNGPFLAISNNNENFFIRAYAQNTTNSSISLVANNVISFLIGPRRLVPITSIMHHMVEGKLSRQPQDRRSSILGTVIIRNFTDKKSIVS